MSNIARSAVSSVVDSTSMTNSYNVDDLDLILDVAYDAVVTDAVRPELGKIARQCLSLVTRIAQSSHVRFKISEDSPLPMPVNSRQVLPGGSSEFNRPDQDAS